MDIRKPKITPNRDLLISLYSAGNSMLQISRQLHCSQNKIVYWMDKYQISKRSRSEASYLNANPSGDPFKIKQPTTLQEAYLYGLGVGIYWGEGEKSSPHCLRVANTDPQIILNFTKFLIDICQIKQEKLSYSLICFNDSSPKTVLKYWAKILKISEVKFGKIVQIPPQGKGIYKRKSQFGVCTVSFCNTKLKKWIMDEILKNKMPG